MPHLQPAKAGLHTMRPCVTSLPGSSLCCPIFKGSSAATFYGGASVGSSAGNLRIVMVFQVLENLGINCSIGIVEAWYLFE